MEQQKRLKLTNIEYIMILMREICVKKIKNADTLSNLAKEIGLESTNPLFQKMKKYMIENNLITIEKGNYNEKSIKINLSKIGKYIRENSEEFGKWGNFIEVTKPASYNY